MYSTHPMSALAYPLAAGQWSVRRHALLCSLPRRTVAVSAPGELLRTVLRLCDGRRRWRAVAEQLARHWSAGEVEAFLRSLAREGVIVEAGEGPAVDGGAEAAWPRVHAGRAPARLPGAPAGFVFYAGPVRVGSVQVFGAGRSDDPEEARRKAEAEAWERRGWATLGRTVEGCFRDIEGAIPPTGIAAYTPAQYASPQFPLRRFSPRTTYLWVPACDVRTGARVHLPAECVHARVALPARMAARACAETSTSGMAAWTDAEGALCRATLELVERDAFARAWLARRPACLLLAETVPVTAQQRVAGLQALGHRVALAWLTAAPVPVIAVFLQHHARPFTAITAAADFDAEVALARALDEAEARATRAAAAPAAPLARASQVRSIEDVDRYYRSPRFHRRADFFATAQPSTSFRAAGACRDWTGLQRWLAERKLDLVAADVTPPGAALAQGRVPLRVMRAVVPGLIPIWFRHGMEPAGLPAFAAAQAGAPAPRHGAPFVHPFT